MGLLIMTIYTVLFEKFLYNFMIKRAQYARYNQFLLQNVQNNEIFEIFRMFRNSS